MSPPSDRKNLLYVFSQAPYSTASGQEALDAVLIGAAFEQSISVLFVHDGVFQLINNQNAQGTAIKQYSKAFRALEDFGVEHVYVHDLSLMARGIGPEQLMIELQTSDSDQIRNLIAAQDRVFTF